MQQVRVIKDADGNVLTSEKDVLKQWLDYFKKLMNEENPRERRQDEVDIVIQDVTKISEDEVRVALRRMKNGKAMGPDDIQVEVCMQVFGKNGSEISYQIV